MPGSSSTHSHYPIHLEFPVPELSRRFKMLFPLCLLFIGIVFISMGSFSSELSRITQRADTAKPCGLDNDSTIKSIHHVGLYMVSITEPRQSRADGNCYRTQMVAYFPLESLATDSLQSGDREYCQLPNRDYSSREPDLLAKCQTGLAQWKAAQILNLLAMIFLWIGLFMSILTTLSLYSRSVRRYYHMDPSSSKFIRIFALLNSSFFLSGLILASLSLVFLYQFQVNLHDLNDFPPLTIANKDFNMDNWAQYCLVLGLVFAFIGMIWFTIIQTLGVKNEFSASSDGAAFGALDSQSRINTETDIRLSHSSTAHANEDYHSMDGNSSFYDFSNQRWYYSPNIQLFSIFTVCLILFTPYTMWASQDQPPVRYDSGVFLSRVSYPLIKTDPNSIIIMYSYSPIDEFYPQWKLCSDMGISPLQDNMIHRCQQALVSFFVAQLSGILLLAVGLPLSFSAVWYLMLPRYHDRVKSLLSSSADRFLYGLVPKFVTLALLAMTALSISLCVSMWFAWHYRHESDNTNELSFNIGAMLFISIFNVIQFVVAMISNYQYNHSVMK